MAQFESREEYERWKATKSSDEPAPPAGLFTVARQKPRTGLVVAGAVFLAAASVFLFATGDKFSGTFVLLLGGSIVALYWRFKVRPWMEDPELMKKSLGLVAKTALTGGVVSPEDAQELRRAEERARANHQQAQAKKP